MENPDKGWTKINVDAAAPDTSIGVETGAVAHDYEGYWRGSISQRMTDMDVVQVELEVIIVGLKIGLKNANSTDHH